MCVVISLGVAVEVARWSWLRFYQLPEELPEVSDRGDRDTRGRGCECVSEGVFVF